VNVNAMLVAPSVTGFSITSAVCMNSNDSAARPVDTVMPAAAMSFACARLTATVRVASSAPWFVVTALVVTPVSITTVHLVFSSMSAVPDVSCSVAVADTDPVPATVNVVVPQPSFVSAPDGSDALVSVKVGSTRSMVSPDFSGAFSSNAYEIDEGTFITGLDIVSALCVIAAATSAVDFSIAAVSVAEAASVNVTVR
jgi:hypothetical protein